MPSGNGAGTVSAGAVWTATGADSFGVVAGAGAGRVACGAGRAGPGAGRGPPVLLEAALLVTGEGGASWTGAVWVGAGWVTMRRCGWSWKSRSCAGPIAAGGGGGGAGAGVAALLVFCASRAAGAHSIAAPSNSLLTRSLILSPDPLRALKNPCSR